MKNQRLGLATLFIAMIFVTSCGAKGPDPTVVDAQHYKVAYENDKVRVLHVTIGPHEKTPMHYHPRNIVIVVTKDRARETLENGKNSEGDNTPGAGAGGAVMHSVENLSDTTMERYIVEFKE